MEPTTPPRPLLVTGDAALAADLHRLAAAAGATLDVDEADVARGRWTAAPVVLVGADAVASVAESRPARRERVHVVGAGPLPDGLFRPAVEIGAESVVELPAAEAWLVELLADTADGAPAGGAVVGVLGGCGGAGATTFAAALGLVAARDGDPVTLVDTDRLGSGVERVVGLDDAGGSGWTPLLETVGRLGSRSLRAALPRYDGLAVLGWGRERRQPLDPDVVREVLGAAQRGSSLVVLDLPRYLDAATVEAVGRCDHLVLVVPLDVAAVSAAVRVLADVVPLAPEVHLVARGPVTGLDPEQVAATLGLGLAAVMTDQRRLRESVELGLGPVPRRRGPLARAARTVLGRVAGGRVGAGAR